MSFGVLPTGFSAKSIQDILSEIEAAERAEFGEQIDLGADSVFGQLNGVVAAQIAEMWELVQAVYASFNPDQAGDASLDAVSSITGTSREPATHSTVTLAANLAAGVQLLVGRVVSDVIGNRFVTTEIVENVEAYAQTLNVLAESEEWGPVFVAAHQLVNIETPVSGWSEAAALTSGNAQPYVLVNGQTLTIEVDGGAAQTATFNTHDFINIGSAAAFEVAAVISADITGATASAENGYVRITSDNADGETSSIEVTGGTANGALGFATDLIAGMNPLDADPGVNLETDAEYRMSRLLALRAQGDATIEAIIADISVVDGVDDAFVYDNTTEFTDAAGRPPHSVDLIVLGQDPDTDLDDRVGAALFATKAAGIQTYREPGATGRTITVTDSQGVDYDMHFSRADLIEIYVVIDVDVIDGDYAGDDVVKTALVAQGSSYTIGQDVVAEANKAAAFAVNGVYDVTDYRIGTAPAPAGVVNIVIDIREIALFDTARITVNATPVVPS